MCGSTRCAARVPTVCPRSALLPTSRTVSPRYERAAIARGCGRDGHGSGRPERRAVVRRVQARGPRSAGVLAVVSRRWRLALSRVRTCEPCRRGSAGRVVLGARARRGAPGAVPRRARLAVRRRLRRWAARRCPHPAPPQWCTHAPRLHVSVGGVVVGARARRGAPCAGGNCAGGRVFVPPCPLRDGDFSAGTASADTPLPRVALLAQSVPPRAMAFCGAS